MPSMHPPEPSDSDDVVLGVDTHKDAHVAAVLTALGVLLATKSFPTTAKGYRQMLAWTREFGTVHRAGVECTGSYGAALSRHLRSQALTVIEVNRSDRGERRRRGQDRHHRRRGRSARGAVRASHRDREIRRWAR
jgi:transposase